MSSDIENHSLEAHVSLCELRYQAIDSKLTNLEAKLDQFEEKIAGFRLDFFKICIGTAGSIITAIIGAITVIKW